MEPSSGVASSGNQVSIGRWAIGSALLGGLLISGLVVWLCAAPKAQVRKPVQHQESPRLLDRAEPPTLPVPAPTAPARDAPASELAPRVEEAPVTAPTLAVSKTRTAVDVQLGTRDVSFKLHDEPAAKTQYKGVAVTVSGPGGFRRELAYAAGDQGNLVLDRGDGSPLADGLYKYETYAEPLPRTVTPLRAGVTTDTDGRAQRGTENQRTEPAAAATQSGSFRIQDGQIVQPEIEPTQRP